LKPKLIYYGTVSESGYIQLPGIKMRSDAALFFRGKRIQLTLEERKKGRSGPQNRYYFGVVVPIAQAGFRDMGDILSPDQVHEFFKWRFLKVQKNGYEYAKSTADLSTVEFSDYVEQCAKFCAEFLNIEVPLPNE
jgi:hypothetical protein